MLNVTEEMAIASGMQFRPSICLTKENGINAFAAGTNSGKYCDWNFERSARHILSRDELQCVIAHEFSHILHGDTRINIRLIGLIFGLTGMAMLGKGLIYGGSETYGARGSSSTVSESQKSKNDNGEAILVAIALLCILCGTVFSLPG